jgi:hypothetical protein
MGLLEAPNPGRSIAMTRWFRASPPTIVRNDAFVAPSPWIKTTGGSSGEPATKVEIVALRTCSSSMT